MARERAFFGTGALLFLASAGGTAYWCGSMSGGMPMPGDWTMSMAWMRMPGQTWLGAAASFMAMWIVMMVAMMLPSLVPMLSGYRRTVEGSAGARLDGLTALAGAAYFAVWALVGAAAYPLGVLVATAAMQWPALARCVPFGTGVVLLLAGVVQHTAWKSYRLGRCRAVAACSGSPASGALDAWRHGLRLGVDCVLCCSGLMATLLVTGVMDLGAMLMVAVAITVERCAPRPERAVRITGAVLIATGTLAIARVLGLG